MKDGKFHPHTQYKKGIRKSRDQSTKLQGVRMKRYNVCDPFLEDPASHKPDDTKHTNQIMYSLGDESCASILTDEEFSMLLTDNQVANTFSPIGDTATKWQQDDAFRKRIIDRAQELIEEQKKGERKARDGMPLPILETGLDDIFDDVRQTDPEFVKLYGDDKIDDSKLTKAVGDNIIYILKREKRLKNDEHISVGNINFREETEDDSGHYQYDYSVWKNNPRTLTNKGGTAYGMISNGTLIDMNLELFNTDKMP